MHPKAEEDDVTKIILLEGERMKEMEREGEWKGEMEWEEKGREEGN